MRKGVVVATCEKTSRTWLVDCLRSLADVPVTIAYSTPQRNEFDVAALRVGCELFDEFWMLPDTTLVKDVDLLVLTLAQDGRSFSAGPGYISCIGKVCTADAKRVGLPQWPRTKMDAVNVELGWFRRYAFATGATVLDPGFTDGPRREERHGRLNMVLESDLFIKWKGTWDVSMIVEEAGHG